MRALVLALCLVVAGCGDDAPADMAADLSVADLAADQSVPKDMTYVPWVDGGPFMCGATTCGPGTTCCVRMGDGGTTATCETSCAGLTVECQGPQHCGGNPCCLTLSSQMPQSIACTNAQTACPPNLDVMGNGMTRLCNVDGDCTAGASSTSYPDCCTVNNQRFCFNKQFVGFVPGATCP